MRSPTLHAILLACAALAPVAPAQGEYDFDRTTPGTLGATLSFEYGGSRPGTILLFMLGDDRGPTPLAILDPTDPRVLEVGLLYSTVWFTLGNPTGAGTIDIPLPASVDLHGVVLYFQTLTAPGVTRLVDQVSNPVTAQFGSPVDDTVLPAVMATPRAFASAILDRDNNGGQGDVVIAGGGHAGAYAVDTSEVYDFRRMEMRPGPKLTTARAMHATVRLQDGRVLLVGGVDPTGSALASAEIYDPTTDQFTATGSMSFGRVSHAAALMGDGRVMVVAGTSTVTDPIAAALAAQATSEIYDPTAGTWSSGPGLPYRLIAPSLVSLRDGRVLLTGGYRVNVVFGIPFPAGTVKDCYALEGGSWVPKSPMNSARAGHTFNTVVLDDGRVLVTGGTTAGTDPTAAGAIDASELYYPAANVWLAMGKLPRPSTLHTMTRTADGKFVLAGGVSGTLLAPVPLRTALEFNPKTLTFRALDSLSVERSGHVAAETPDGLLVLFGGQSGSAATLTTTSGIRR